MGWLIHKVESICRLSTRLTIFWLLKRISVYCTHLSGWCILLRHWSGDQNLPWSTPTCGFFSKSCMSIISGKWNPSYSCRVLSPQSLCSIIIRGTLEPVKNPGWIWFPNSFANMQHCKSSSRVLEKIKFQEEWQYCCELSEFDNSVAFWLVFF